jgi:hypothetical protein
MGSQHFFSRLLIAGASTFLTCLACAQSGAADSTRYQRAIAAARSAYQEGIGDQSALYNGMLYPGYPFSFAGGGPFFNEGKADTGSLDYAGMHYSGVTLRYDDLSELVLTSDQDQQVELDNKKMIAFSIGSHYFTRVGGHFYEVFYPGKSSVLGRTVKTLTDHITDNGVVDEQITATTAFYIVKDGLLRPAGKKAEVLEILSDKKKEIATFIKKSRLRFGKDTEKTLTALAAFYDGLIPWP